MSGYAETRLALCRRLDQCRDLIVEAAIYKDLPAEDWPAMKDTLKKAVFSMRSAITDVEWLSRHSND